MAEPTQTAALLLVIGLLVALSALSSRATRRTGIPAALLFLALGMLAGSQGLGRIEFEDYRLSFRLGTVALVLILFDGGFNTRYTLVKRWLAPAGVLATAGVIATMGLVAVAARAFGFAWPQAFLLGAVVSSTDAAVVFATLRSSGIQLKSRVAATLELESGLNDPMAIILTMALTASITGQQPLGWSVIPGIALQVGVGVVAGLGIGHGARRLLSRARPVAAGLYPVLSIAIAFIAFGVPTLLHGSGFLAVYLAGIVLGNGPVPYRGGVVRVHDAAAWFGQVGMFLLLGLLVFPLDLIPVAGPGFGIALLLAVVARPMAVLACLLPFGFRIREAAYIGLCGLRGAVPIILATLPVLAGVAGAHRIFNVVFFVVVVGSIVPGMMLRRLTRIFGVAGNARPIPSAVLEIISTRPLKGELASFFIHSSSTVVGSSIAELPFPESAAAVLLIRGDELIAPKGGTVLQPGDHVYVFFRPEERGLVLLLFGREEAD